MSAELDPRQRALKMEGDALLQKALQTAGRPAPEGGITNLSGEVISTGAPAPAADRLPTKEQLAERAKRLEEQRQAHALQIEAYSKRLKELMQHKPTADALTLVLLGHYIITFAKQELSFQPGMTDELMDYGERFMHARANSQEGFDVKRLENDVKHQLLPILRTTIRKWEGQAALRRKRMKQLHSRLPNGITLPGKLGARFPKGFRFGDMLIIHGSQEAVQTAMTLICNKHQVDDKATAYRLSLSASETNHDYTPTFIRMGLSWWRGKADNAGEFYEMLAPVSEAECGLLTVDEVEQLCSPENRSPLERKANAIRALRQWSFENACAVVAGDINTEDVPDTRIYGIIPHVAAKIDTCGESGTKVLVLDGHPIELEV